MNDMTNKINNRKYIIISILQMLLIISYPYIYKFVEHKVGVTLDFKYAVIPLAVKALIGITLSVGIFMGLKCIPKIAIITEIIKIILLIAVYILHLMHIMIFPTSALFAFTFFIANIIGYSKLEHK
ncbi:MAG: hypothetical protein RR048_01935 [Oscillospiraceae bacterium]